MSTELLAPAHPILVRARVRALEQSLSCAGAVTPPEAWALVQSATALLVDVRSAEERHFVGEVPGSLHVPWACGLKLERNPHFVEQLERVAERGQPLLLMCRSGKRSALAAEAATRAGFAAVYNVLEGFEGDHDESWQRGRVNGWRFHGLPWEQD